MQTGIFMALSGDLKTFFITTILQLLQNNAKTGVLRVWCSNDKVKIYVHKGAIIYAVKLRHDHRLGQLLKKQGLISDQQLKECLSIGREKKLTLGKVLNNKGYVNSACLKKQIFKQAENAIYEMIFWTDGNFEYKDADIDLNKLIVTKIHIMSVILEASRKIDEMSVFKKQIPEDTIKFRLSEKATGFKDVVLNEEELQILLLIDGQTTVSDIIKDGLYSQYAAYKLLNALLSSGYIEPADKISPVRQAEEALLDTTDIE
jgi:hypothetical protein